MQSTFNDNALTGTLDPKTSEQPLGSKQAATSGETPVGETPMGDYPSSNIPKPSKRDRIRRFFAVLYPYAHYGLPILAAILTLVNTHILIGPQLNRSGDNDYHLLNEFALLNGILGGDNPFGPLAMEFGQPVLRFYQALFYLFNVGVHLVTSLNLRTAHNLTIIICFASSPFAYMYFLRKLGLPRFAASIGAMVSMISIDAFGNSFEAYHQAGIVTQSMGGLFFPWFMGHFVGMLRGENRASSTALLFAIAFASHAAMSVFAAFGAGLYFLAASRQITLAGLRKLAVFGLLGGCLVSFWVFPFIEHTDKMRPVPDSIIRTGVRWFTSVSKDELTMVLFTGRLLDDPPRLGDKRDENDKLMDDISIIHAVKTRPPVVTILTGLGFIIALFGIRRPPQRFLIAGFLFSLMLFAGPDDFPWLKYLPFMKNIQTFRCTYLVEFFAFGLIGLGVETILRKWISFALRRGRKAKIAHLVGWIAVAVASTAAVGTEIVLLGGVHVRIRETNDMDENIDALSTMPVNGRPYRVMPKFEGRYKLRQAWYSVNGIIPYCTHWKGTGPTAAFNLCSQLGTPTTKSDLNALVGARYFSGTEDQVKSFMAAKDSDGAPIMERLPNGKSRTGKPTDWHYLLDTGRDHFLRPLVGEPLPAVVSHSQWMWLAKAWAGRYSNNLWEEETPIPMRVMSGDLKAGGLLDRARAVLYLDHTNLKKDFDALKAFSENGGMVISPVEISGIVTHAPTLKPKKSFWDLLPNKKANPKVQVKDHREEMDPGFEIADVTELSDNNRLSVQRFAFDVDALRPTTTILPTEAVPGWTATLDDKPMPLFAAGPDLVGVVIPEGAHRLVFTWLMPKIHKLALIVSLSTLALVIGILGLAGYRAIRRVY
jgi:hypothetical protein